MYGQILVGRIDLHITGMRAMLPYCQSSHVVQMSQQNLFHLKSAQLKFTSIDY